MERIHKLPFILGCLAAMTAGVSSYMAGSESRTVYLRMAVMMLTFFIIGIYIKNTVLSIDKEVQKKKLEREEEEQKLEILKKQEEAAALLQQSAYQDQSQGQQHKLDLLADDANDDFEPLAISKAIKSKVLE